MSDFSKKPLTVLQEALKEGYTGIHIEQGVPILDRDLNLMHDLLASRLQSMLSQYIGDGIPSGVDGFAIRALPDGQNVNNFEIAGPGTCLVGGTQVTICKNYNYLDQPFVSLLPEDDQPKELKTPPPSGPTVRRDSVYLDVFLVEVDGTPELDNHEDVGMQTSIRIKPVWIVRVAEGSATPPEPTDSTHMHYPLADLGRPPGEATITAGPISDSDSTQRITDLRQRRLRVAELETRLSLLEDILFAPAFTKDPDQGQLEPKQGTVNARITLRGTNFKKREATTVVRFGNTIANIEENGTDNVIVARVPAGLTRPGNDKGRNLPITVENDIGSAVSESFFTVSPHPAFADRPLDPERGPTGTIVTISGFNFTPGEPTVTFGGKKATVDTTQSTDTVLTVSVPEDCDVTAVKVVVAFPDPPRGSSTPTDTRAPKFTVTE